MAGTYKNAKLTKIEANSQDASTGAISTTDVEGGEQDLGVEVPDSVTDPDGATVYTVARLPASIAIFDYDFCFVDTLNSGKTLEGEMAARNKVFVKMHLQGGTIQLPNGDQWLGVRPTVFPDIDAGTDDDLVAGMLEFTHSVHDGVQRPV
jgi:hypothetical protein